MKQKITHFRWLVTTLLLVAAMVMPSTAWADEVTKEMYTVFDTSSGTLTVKYDSSKPESSDAQKVYAVPTIADVPGWINAHASAIKKVVFDASFADARPTMCHSWFVDCSALTEIDGIANLNTSEVTDMQFMFYGCSNLTSLDLSGFDTQKVMNMSDMFINCKKLKTIYVSDKFVTTVVSSSSSMFSGCESLEGAIIYDPSKTDATYANYTTGYFTKTGTVATPKGAYAIYTVADNTLTFKYGVIPASEEGVLAVYKIPISFTPPGWTTDHASDIKKVVFDASFADARPTMCYSWFNDCSALTEIDGIANLNTSEVMHMSFMFYGCSNLTSLDLSGFDTQKVMNMSGMFINCKKLKTIYVSDKFVTTVVSSSSNMFSGCESLEGAIIYDPTKTDATFANCTTGYFTNESEKANFGFHAVYNSSSNTLTFKYGNKTKVDSNETAYELNTGATAPEWISNTGITTVVFDESFEDALPTSCFQWFNGLSSLTTIEGIEYLNTSEVTTMNEMFSGCSSLSSLQLKAFNTAKVTDMTKMFYNCSALTTIYTSDLFVVSAVSASDDMFTGCTNLDGAITYDAGKVNKDYANGETGYFIQKPEGEGTPESPYLIRNAGGLAWFRDHVNQGNKTACARLEADIDMSSVCHAANGNEGVAELSWVPISDRSQVGINRWYGTFDGNNKTISNLYINTTAQHSGLFGYIQNPEASERGSIKNIIFENVKVTSSVEWLGVLAGYAKNTVISGITVNSGTVNGTEYCGGIVGNIAGSSLSGCINKINIFGGSNDDNTNIGGIVGCAENSSYITNCANYGNVNGNFLVGGIAGTADGTTIENVFSSGDVACIETSSVASTGLVVGCIYQNVTISGNVIYNSEANLSYGTTQQTAKAFGRISSSSTVTESDATGMTEELLATGEAAYLLNGSSPYGKWGQQIEVDSYPVPGSDKTVYCGYNKDNCLEITYSNNQEELSENPVHHYDNGFCKDCDVYQPATLNASGEYEIGNAGQLYWFAALVNGDANNETDNPTGTNQNRAACAVLTADITVENKRIWTPIGCDESGYEYEGTFDGQYHTIKGLYYEGSESQGIGLFSQLERGTIQNVGVVDFSFTSTNTESRVAGICAYNYSGTIKNCFCTGEIHSSSAAGGVCANNQGNLSNCYFSGEIVDETNPGNVGGVCYNNSGSISNCYHNIDKFPGDAIEGDPAGDAFGKTTAEFASGEVAYLLQGNQSEAVWGQTIGSEPYPVFSGAKVYEGYVACLKQYSNSELSTTPTPHDYSKNGICNTCHAYKPATLTTDKYDIDNDGTNDNVYEIYNAGQLYWFAALVNGDTGFEGVTEADGTANARLMNDIIVNANVLNGQGELNAGTSYTVWTPIGNSSDFRGIFDGAGHNVSGLYINDTETDFVGFFASSRGTIKNVGVVDSYIKGKEHVAGVCAYNMYGTISNCYNEGTVCGGGNYVGGVCSESYGGTVTNCYNAGAVSGTGYHYVGGLCGDNYNGTITYSFNRGKVSGVSYVGGICGRDNDGNIKNCYYLSGTANTGIGYVSDGVKVESKTAEQFAGGEVCYMLNGYRSAGTAENPLAWYQNLSDKDGDAYPVYTRTETNTVYGGYDHGGTTLYCGNNSKIPTAHPHVHGYDSTAEDEASGNHDKSYEAKFVWTDNEDKTSASVTARFTCQVCNQELTPEVTAVQDQEHSNSTATCTEDAQNTYTTSYRFTGAIFTDTYKQVITPALGHDLTEIEFSETYKIYFNACKRKDCGHKGYYAQSDGTMPAVFRDNYTGYVVEKADLTDAKAYTSLARFTVDTLNYTRKFSDDKWMAVYVPFVIDCDILDDEYEMAVINNFHEYEQEDGSYKVVLEVKRVTRGGTIPALTPCLIRMKTAPEAETFKTLTFTNVEFEPAAQKYIDCASMTSYYKFLGTLDGKDGFNESTDYVLSNGILYKAGNNTHLYPQRWYLSTSLISNGSTSSSAKVRSISIGVIGDGDTTGIEEIYVNTESCADADSNSAIYDLQGRKLSREPQKGIYIKNGVKLVK